MSSFIRRISFVAISISLVWLSRSSICSAVQILGDNPTNGTFVAERHERFYDRQNDSDFLGSELGMTGISYSLNNVDSIYRFATMISDTHFITATHARNAPGDTIVFHRENSQTGGEIWNGSQVVGGFRLFEAGPENTGGPTDLWIGELDVAPPSWVQRYPIMKRPSEYLNYNPYGLNEVSSELYLIGKYHPPNPTFQNPGEVRVGRTVISGTRGYDTVNTPFGGKALDLSDQSVFANDFAQLQGGDSGGPGMTLLPHLGGVLTTVHHTSTLGLSISHYADQIAAAVSEPVTIVTDLAGDLNADFKVNGTDFNILAYNYGNADPTYAQGDIDLDGDIDGDDYNLLAFNFGKDLYSPADFNGDLDVDYLDFQVLGEHWQQSVSAGMQGDVNGDGFVDRMDIGAMNDTWRFSVGSGSPSQDNLYRDGTLSLPYDITGDANRDGLVDYLDAQVVGLNWETNTTPGQDGDVDYDGYVDSTDFNIVAQNLNPGITPVDLNLDGKVDIQDADLLASNWGTTSVGRPGGDFDEDGDIDSADFFFMGTFWGWGITEAQAAIAQIVPEPTTSSLFLISAIFASIRRQATTSRL